MTFQTIKIALKVELLRFFFSPIASPYLPKDNRTNMYILLYVTIPPQVWFDKRQDFFDTFPEEAHVTFWSLTKPTRTPPHLEKMGKNFA